MPPAFPACNEELQFAATTTGLEALHCTLPCHLPLQLTYPLDMLRFRIAVDPSCRSIGGAVAVLLKEGRGAAFYRGLGASLLGEHGATKACAAAALLVFFSTQLGLWRWERGLGRARCLCAAWEVRSAEFLCTPSERHAGCRVRTWQCQVYRWLPLYHHAAFWALLKECMCTTVLRADSLHLAKRMTHSCPPAGIAPYMALELTTFDLLPRDKLPGFARGFAAALVATVACYPLDTVRWAASG